MRRLVGYDLNGWRDLAVRNWIERPGDDPEEGGRHLVSGGVGGVVVSVGEAPAGDAFVGGVQALMAPHGRGGGWGPIGAAENRRRVIDLLDDPAANRPEIAVALRSMADPHGATAVLAIPDTGPYEEQQEALIAVLRRLRALRPLLVWRPVLACLSALERGLIDGAGVVGVVGHDAQGFTSQILRIREDRGHLAPERRRAGRPHPAPVGLRPLLDGAWRALAEAVDRPEDEALIAATRSLVPLALGESAGAELVRRPNADWTLLHPPPPEPPSSHPVPPSLIEALADCDAVLFESPAEGSVRTSLLAVLADAPLPPPIPLAHDDVARGACIAAERIAAGLPVYFDFLPQISTIVQGEEGPRSFDLIPPDAVLPAGRVYRSAEPARLGLLAGTDVIRVHLRKETAARPRRANVPLSVPPTQDAEVRLHVEQAPAAGRARLTLESDVLPGPLVVDWEAADALEGEWDEIIAKIPHARPSVPSRLVLPCGIAAWEPQPGRRSGLAQLLAEAAENDRPPDWNRLATAMAARPFGEFAISSDGELPDGLDPVRVRSLDAITERAEAHVRDRLTGRIRDDNASLRFLTWQFRRCPQWLVGPLLDALAARPGDHVFVGHAASRQLVYHALGRITIDPEDQRAVFDRLLALPATAWNRDPLACAGFLLSRTDSAPLLTTAAEIHALAEIVETRTRLAIGGAYNSDFFYAPFLMIGLLRRRLVEPWSLVAGRDPAADALLSAIEAVMADMGRRLAGRSHVDAQLGVLRECCEVLRGGGRPDGILVDLSRLTSA